MVLHIPNEVPVQKLFDLTGKVVAVTGKHAIGERFPPRY